MLPLPFENLFKYKNKFKILLTKTWNILLAFQQLHFGKYHIFYLEIKGQLNY